MAKLVPKVRVITADETLEKTRREIRYQLDHNPVITFYMILVVTVLLAGIGLLMVFSASSISGLTNRHAPLITFLKPATYCIVGLFCMWVASRANIRLLLNLKVARGILLVAIVLQCLVVPFGANIGGNRNWIYLFGFSFQPSEPLKLAMIIYLAALLGRRRVDFDSWSDMAKQLALPVGGSVAVVLLGRDMGTAIVFLLIAFAMLFVCGLPAKKIWHITLPALFLVAVLVARSPSRRARILTFLPFMPKDAQGIDMQEIRSKWGLGTGGLTGVGPGASRQKWNFLPQADSDFIFAILGEEFGLVGTLSVITLYVLLAIALVRLARRCKEYPVVVLSYGTLAWIEFQALINIAVVVGISPVIGVPLPFISSGGSALLSCLMGMGVMLACAKRENGAYQILARKPSLIRKTLAVVGNRKKEVE
ncbi:MAG: putative peptidoglycan glycosyltransferase FtsW [Actinomycetaceae bacterium]|nr:putative peptidoglycan glycosyltransferase FtsW [Actinomycetaceae bacterium]